jgi:hypothetical protein
MRKTRNAIVRGWATWMQPLWNLLNFVVGGNNNDRNRCLGATNHINRVRMLIE